MEGPAQGRLERVLRCLGWGLLGLLGLRLLALLWPFFGANLLRGDGAGQLFLTWLTARDLLPWGTGWSDLLWGGFPVGYQYPPLFHVIAAALSLPLGLLPALRLLTVLGILATLALFWRLDPAREQAPWGRGLLLWALLGFLLMPSAWLGFQSAPGANLESVLGNGMLPSGAGLALLLAFLWALEHRRPLATPLLLAATMSTHLIWGLLAALMFLGEFLLEAWALWRRRQGLRALRLLLAWPVVPGLLALLVCGWWLLPFLWNLGNLGGTSIGLQAHWWLLLLPPLALMTVQWDQRRSVLWGLLVLAAVLLGLLSGLGLLRLHSYRFVLPALIGAIPLLWAALGRGHLAWLRLPVALGLGAFAWVAPLNSAGNPELPPFGPLPQVTGATLPLEDPLHSPGYLALPHALAREGRRASHGISVESSPVAPAWMHLMASVQRGAYTWGVEPLCEPCPGATAEVLEGMARALGLGAIVTDRRLDKVLPPALILDYRPVLDFPRWTQATEGFDLSADGSAFAFGLTRLDSGAEALLLPGLEPVPASRWTPKLWGGWFASGAQGPWPIQAASAQAPQVPQTPQAGPGPRPLEVQDLSAGRGLKLRVLAPASDAPRPVALLRAAHPWWRARDAQGLPLSPSPCGPGWICVEAHGPVVFEWVEGAEALVGKGLTVLGLVLGAIVAVLGGRRRRLPG